jgi:hypothetical protein
MIVLPEFGEREAAFSILECIRIASRKVMLLLGSKFLVLLCVIDLMMIGVMRRK